MAAGEDTGGCSGLQDARGLLGQCGTREDVLKGGQHPEEKTASASCFMVRFVTWGNSAVETLTQ